MYQLDLNSMETKIRNEGRLSTLYFSWMLKFSKEDNSNYARKWNTLWWANKPLQIGHKYEIVTILNIRGWTFSNSSSETKVASNTCKRQLNLIVGGKKITKKRKEEKYKKVVESIK